MSLDVLWHDVECGGYVEDLALWRELADREGDPVLDVGAGTGRVALDLAWRGHEVVALDVDSELLAALRKRATGLPVETVAADARDFALGRTFPLILAPMQTVQLLGGGRSRAAFLACARAHLAPGGLLAAALADALVPFDEDDVTPPLPDMREEDGIVYSSRPVAVRDEGDRAAIHRLREVVLRDGRRTESANVVRLDRVSPDELAREAAVHGLSSEAHRRIDETDEYVGSTVVMLRG